jgi:hypothetical protein
MMTEEELDRVDFEETPKRPNFLVFLIVLTGISVFMLIYSSLEGLIKGPFTEEYLEHYMAEQYEALDELKNVFGSSGRVVEIAEQAIAMAVYQNNEVFYLFNIFTLIQALLGMAAIVLMFRLKKIGFHLYVGYCLFPILMTYLLFPAPMISAYLIMGTLLISTLFCVLYGLNLKHMK